MTHPMHAMAHSTWKGVRAASAGVAAVLSGVRMALAVLLVLSGCAGSVGSGARHMGAAPSVAVGEALAFSAEPGGRPRTPGLLLVREAELQLQVKDVESAARSVTKTIEAAGGFPEDIRVDTASGAEMVFRLPAAALDATLVGLEAHGRVQHKRVLARNVTEEAIDLQARVDNLIALRNRVRQQLERAASLDEALRLEEQLTRLQTQIDALIGRLETLRAAAELAKLTVELQRPTRLGPVAWAGNQLVQLTSKLFVLAD